MPAGNAHTVFRKAAALMGQPWSAVDTDTFDMIATSFGKHLQVLWETTQWPELMRVEKRLRMKPWQYGTVYPTSSTALHFPSNKCFVVIDPGGALGADEPSISPKWLELKRDFGAKDWKADQSYQYGDVVRWGRGKTYAYTGANALVGVAPDDASRWLPIDVLQDFPINDVMGQLDDLGSIMKVTPDDPLAYDVQGDPLEHWLTPTGVRVQGDPGSAWFVYRAKVPAIIGGAWDAAATYAPGDQVYFEVNRVGNFYTATDWTLGDAPDGSQNGPGITGPPGGGAPQNITGNAATATKLQTPRDINGVTFDGSADITVPVDVVSNVATGVLLGRASSGSGDSEELLPAAVRALLELGTAATQPSTAFDAAGAASTAQAYAIQRANHTGTQLLATISDAGNAASRNVGTTAGTVAAGDDARLTNARTPTSHASTHASGGTDPITVAQSQVTSLTTDLAAKAPLASPALTGTPTAPTAASGTSTTQIATTAFVATAIAAFPINYPVIFNA